MILDVPDNARVGVVIVRGKVILTVLLPDADTRPPLAAAAPATPDGSAFPSVRPRRPRHLLRGAAVLALIVAAYVVGEHRPSHSGALAPARAALATAPAPSSPPLPRDVAAFRQQLQAPPTVTPPPGAPAPAARPGADGFGMEN